MLDDLELTSDVESFSLVDSTKDSLADVSAKLSTSEDSLAVSNASSLLTSKGSLGVSNAFARHFLCRTFCWYCLETASLFDFLKFCCLKKVIINYLSS